MEQLVALDRTDLSVDPAHLEGVESNPCVVVERNWFLPSLNPFGVNSLIPLLTSTNFFRLDFRHSPMSSSQPSTPSSAPSELNAFQLRKRRISSNLKDSAVKRGKRAATEEAEEGEIREVKLDEVESIVALPLEPIAVRQAISTRTRSPETPYPSA